MPESGTCDVKPDFLIIGAQKAGTTWLWRMLEQHPDTDLPQEKEIHYFGSSEHYCRSASLHVAVGFNGIEPR